ncbi:MAG: NAD(P)-dependent oxidoreductase [Bacteroidota bacterium]
MSKVAFITGSSRGIGRAIALKLASEGYNIVIAAKTTEPHPKLKGTIFTVANEVEALGVKALPIKTDIRSEENVIAGMEQVEKAFGKIDVLVNNASAINLTNFQNLPMKRYDLMQDINARGTFMVSKYAIPLLRKGENAHILTLSPPLNLNPMWFKMHCAYTMSKYGMSMTVLGLSEELREYKIAANALWPQTAIATAAVEFALGGPAMMQQSRTTDIMADAASAIINRDSAKCTGNFFIDEEVLKEEGITDFEKYAVNPEKKLLKDFFLD